MSPALGCSVAFPPAPGVRCGLTRARERLVRVGFQGKTPYEKPLAGPVGDTMRFLLFCLAVLLAQCNRAPRDKREWRPGDHDHAVEPVRGQVDVSRGSDPKLLARGVDEVIVAAWRTQCMRCHGMAGRGDGPEGRRWQAPDLSRLAWQSGVTDEQVAEVIVNGK